MKKLTPIILCVILYIVLLFSAFSTQYDVDTYICYTTRTGECYHAEYCGYLRSSKYKTTVYEAKKKYRECSRCYAEQNRYKTTITVTERDYLTPAIISIAATVIGVLIYKKFKEQ